MFETVRSRLTLWYVSLLAAILVIVIALIYVLLARALYVRVDDSLHAVVDIAATSLANDLNEGQGIDDGARSRSSAHASSQDMLANCDGRGRQLAADGREGDNG